MYTKNIGQCSKTKTWNLESFGNDKTFTAYQKRGYEFNILLHLHPQTRLWLLSKYCNCMYGKSERSKFDFVVEGGEWFASDDVFVTDIIRVKKDLSLPFQNNLINVIIKRLKDGAYVYGYFDEYFIKSKSAYHDYHFKHSFLVYGCDDKAKTFYALGYTKNYKFETYSITYEEFIMALTSLKQIDINFVCINLEFKYDIKIEAIYYGLYDYVHSICRTAIYDPNVVYGIDTLYKFSDYIQLTVDNQEELDLRYSKFFMEFKEFMLERLKYLYKSSYISNRYEEYIDICKIFQSIHMLFIKYNITGNSGIPQRIRQLLEDVANKEYRILSNSLSELKNSLIAHNNKNYI